MTFGPSAATVLVGSLAGVSSDARRDTPLVGADLLVGPGTTAVPVVPEWETAITVIGGQVTVEGSPGSPTRVENQKIAANITPSTISMTTKSIRLTAT